MRAARIVWLCAAATLATAVAHAQSDSGSFDPNPPLGLLPTSEDALMDPRMARSWVQSSAS